MIKITSFSASVGIMTEKRTPCHVIDFVTNIINAIIALLHGDFDGLTEYMVMIAMLPHQKTPQQTAAHTREARQRKETL